MFIEGPPRLIRMSFAPRMATVFAPAPAPTSVSGAIRHALSRREDRWRKTRSGFLMNGSSAPPRGLRSRKSEIEAQDGNHQMQQVVLEIEREQSQDVPAECHEAEQPGLLPAPFAIPGRLPYPSPHGEAPTRQDPGPNLGRFPPGAHLHGAGVPGTSHRLALVAGEVRRPPGVAGGGGHGQGEQPPRVSLRVLPGRPGRGDLRLIALHPGAEPRGSGWCLDPNRRRPAGRWIRSASAAIHWPSGPCTAPPGRANGRRR